MTADRARIGRRSRRKGKTWERAVVTALRAVGIDAKRGWWQSRGGGEVADVVTPRLWIECGCGAAVDGARKLAQAIGYCDHDTNRRIPVAITRRTGSRRIEVTMRMGDLLAMAEGNVGAFDAETIVTLTFGVWVPVAVAHERRERSGVA